MGETLSADLRTVRDENTLLRARIAELEAALWLAGEKEQVKYVPRVESDTCPEPTDEDFKRLEHHLREEASVHLAPSKIAGVGVFAFRPMKQGVDPFPVCNRHFAAKETFCVFSDSKLGQLPPAVVEELKSFFAPLTEEDGWEPQRDDDGGLLRGVLVTGLSTLNVSWFLNHSDEPNLVFQEAKETGKFCSFVTLRPIESGQELTVNYRELGREYHAQVTGGDL